MKLKFSQKALSAIFMLEAFLRIRVISKLSGKTGKRR